MNKIKEFFEKKAVKIVEAVVIVLAATGLIVGGVKAEEVAKLPVLALGVITAVEGVITFIQGLFTKSK